VMLNKPRESMLGAPAGDVLAGESGRAVLEAVRAATSGAVRSRQSVEMRRAGTGNSAAGVYRVTVRPLRQADAGPMTMVVLEDVTQQRVADESRGLFVTQATHELRQPLTNMRLYIEELIDADGPGAHDPAERARCLNVISGEARRLERIVTDMLSVSEIEAGSLSLRRDDIPLEPMFRELADDFAAAAAGKQVTLSVELPPKLPGGGVIRGDRDKLGLVLHNLVGNAIKYTPNGGKVSVRVRDDAGADAGRLVVDVTDNGIGIKPEEHELIFERFYRAKDRRISSVTGSGLGLALARQIARLHKGDVTLASQIDKGSTFTLSVPIVEDAAVGGGAAESTRRAA
jgi:signal transduction histidine kinase